MKVWTISMCYNDEEIIHESIEQCYATKDPTVETVHCLVDAHWPIDYPKFRRRIEQIAAKFGCVLVDPGRNLGLHGNFNFAWSRFAIPPNAGVIGYDPDSWPITPGWDRAMGEVFDANSKIAWLSLWHPQASRELIQEGRSQRTEVLAGKKIHYLARPALNSICMFRQAYLSQTGGIIEKTPYYGGLEIHMWEHLKASNWEWVFLEEFKEALHFLEKQNPLYRHWKYATTHLGQPQIEFGEWLKTHLTAR